MRQFPPVLWAAFLALSLFLVSCGGGSNTSSVVTSVSLSSPGFTSLNLGDVTAVTGTALNSTNTVVTTAKITYNSSNTNVVTISPTGSVCAGIWDSSFVVCSPGQVGSAQVTSTGTDTTTASTATSSGVTFSVHQKITSVKVLAPSVNCITSAQTLQLSAQAFNGTTDITSTVGAFTWQIASTTIAGINSTGLVTAASPGATNVFAAAGSITSPPLSFTTCAVRSIDFQVMDVGGTSFSIASGATQTLVAKVVDTNGNLITGAALQFNSSQPAVASAVAASSPITNAVVTGAGAGASSIIASCTPPTCNAGFAPIFSNVVKGTVAGTSSTTVYVTGTAASTIIPIPTSSNTAGTPITLPAQPNSFVFNSTGATAYLGSASGLMFLDAGTNTVTSTSSAPGTVLAVAPNGSTIIVANTANGTVSFYSISTNGVVGNPFSVPGTNPRGAFSIDSSRAYIVSDNVLYVFSTTGPLQTFALTAPAKDVAFLAQGSFGYLAGGAAVNAVTARTTCDSSQADIITTPGAPSRIAAVPDGSGMIAVDPPNIESIRASTTGSGCPPPLSDALTTVNTGQASFTPRQIVALSDSSKTYVITDQSNVIVYNNAAGTVSTIPLSGGAVASSGGATLDGASLYLGGSDNSIHRIDTASATDAQQISVSFTPNLVAVRPQ